MVSVWPQMAGLQYKLWWEDARRSHVLSGHTRRLLQPSKLQQTEDTTDQLKCWEREAPCICKNALLSLKQKSHIMGKQWCGTTLWQGLVSDFSLRTTVLPYLVLPKKEESWRKMNQARFRIREQRGQLEMSRAREREREPCVQTMDHWTSLVQGKFIGSLAQIHVICLAVHCSQECILLSVQLDKRARGLSNLLQPGTDSQSKLQIKKKIHNIN